MERAVLKVQVTIEQLGDFASGAWFPNLVQRSQNVLAETTTQIRNLLHRWFHHLKELTKLNCAMSVPARGQRERGMSPRARRQQLDKHVPYCLRPVLSSFANQSVPTLESLGSLHFHFPVVISTRPDNGHPPLPATSLSTCSTPARISLCVRESPVFCISTVTAMSPYIVQSDQQPFLEQTG